MYSHRSMWDFFACVLLTLPAMAWGKDLVRTNEANTPASPVIAAKSAIKITLIPSREQAVAGSYFGITARVENVSDRPVYFTTNSFSMTAPPELDSEGPADWKAFFADIQLPG